MSSRPESKTASQFVSLTLRLKDKLHTPRIRRSERIVRTPTQSVMPPHTHKPEAVVAVAMETQQREVISSLHYFKAVVDRLGVDRQEGDRQALDPSVVGGLLGGASGGVLEAVQTLVKLEPRLHSSKTISTCLTHLYLSVAELILWADQVMLQGVAPGNKDSSASVTTVIRAVLDGVKELVRLAAERQGDSAPLSPDQSQMSEFDDKPSTCRSPSDQDAPPKPPMASKPLPLEPLPLEPFPVQPLPLEPCPLGFSPPALPPKKRQSLPGCRVAIVAPMRREPEEPQEDENLKSRPPSSEDTHCEDDPDYDFLDTDLSSSETLPPLPPLPALPPPSPSSPPPILPEKTRCSTGGTSSGEAPPMFVFDSTSQEANSTDCDNVIGPDDSSPLSPSKTPPPLPEKKRHIHQYLQFCSSYSAQSAATFYKRPLTSSHRGTEPSEPLDSDSAPSPELLPAPVLPPKKRQQDPAGLLGDNQTRDGSRLQEEEKEEEHKEEEQEEVLLTDIQEILQRIIMKPQGEDGPDVKAASPDILLAFASQTYTSTGPGPEQLLFCEAFLSTFRTFISPHDVISKLQQRYKHMTAGQEATARTTFQLLVRVVDELSVVELDSELLLLLMNLVFCLLIGGELALARLLRSNILSKMELKWKLVGSPQSLRPLAARGVAARPGTLLDFRSQDLAEQLTLLDSELFYKIQLPEVLLWSKEQNEERSPNLTEFTQHFNNVSFWVRSVVILQDKHQDREKLLLKFLKVMKHLRKLNNFNSYLSILSALDSAPLRRLDWQRSTAEALEESSSLIDSSSSFRAYRAALADVEPPCIPYLGLILQDLTFVHLGNPDRLTTLQGSKVNFSKCWQQFNILDTLRGYQQGRYSLQPDDDIISFFNDFSDHLAEEALWELSLRLRPRNTPRANQR